MQKSFLPFEKARAFVRKLDLKSRKEWKAYGASRSRPTNIPSDPQKMYEGWQGWGDWLRNIAVFNGSTHTFKTGGLMRITIEFDPKELLSSGASAVRVRGDREACLPFKKAQALARKFDLTPKAKHLLKMTDADRMQIVKLIAKGIDTPAIMTAMSDKYSRQQIAAIKAWKTMGKKW